MKNKIFITVIFCGLTSLLWGQISTDEHLSEIQQAKLKIYSDPFAVIQLGDSLYTDTQLDLKTRVNGLLLVADALIAVRNYAQALVYMDKADDLRPLSSLCPASKVTNLGRYAYLYFQLHLYDKGLQYLKESEQINKQVQNKSESLANLGYIYTVRGLIYKNIMGCEMALRYFDKAIKTYTEVDVQNVKINLSIIHYNMGNCFLNLSNFKLAQQHYLLADNMAKKYGSAQGSLQLFAQKGLANVYIAKGKYSKAIDVLLSAYKLAQGINDKSLSRSLASDLAESYLKQEDWTNYYYYSGQYDTLNSSILKFKAQATTYALNNLRASNHKIVSQKKYNFKLYVLILGGGFVLIIGLLLRWIINIKQRIKQSKAELFRKD